MAEHVHRLGFRRLELDARHPDGLSDFRQGDAGRAEQTRRLLADYGLTPGAYAAGAFTLDDEAVLERAFAFAQGLGVGTISGGAQEAVLDRLDELCARYDLRFAVKNQPEQIFARAGDLLPALARHSDRLGADLDNGFAHAAGLDVVEQARKLRGRIYHVHLRDSDPAEPLGQGNAGVLAFLDELRAQEYAGGLAIEQGDSEGIGAEQLDDILRDSLALVRSVLKS